MEILNVLTDPILPVFAILAFGFGMGRAGRVGFEDARLINRFAMTVLLPILVFGLIANAPIRSFSPTAVAVYASVQAVVFTLGYLLARRVFRREAGEAVLLGFCGIFANNVFYVLPISILLYGEGGVLPITTIITLDSIVTFGGALIALQMIGQGRLSLPGIGLSIVKTPLLQAILLGLAASLAGIALPAPVQTFIDFNGVAGPPVALFAMGVVMSQTPLRPDATVLAFTLVKLLVFPAAIWAGLEIFAREEPSRGLFLLGAAGPAGAMAFSLALLHDIRTDAIARVVIWTSILTLATLAALA